MADSKNKEVIVSSADERSSFATVVLPPEADAALARVRKSQKAEEAWRTNRRPAFGTFTRKPSPGA